METKKTLTPIEKLFVLADCLTAEGQHKKAARVEEIGRELKTAIGAHEAMIHALKEVVWALDRGGLKANADKLFPTGAFELRMEICRAIAKAEGK